MRLRSCMLLAALLYASANAQTTDVTPPSLLTFSFTPASLDTRSGPQDIAFTATASDNLAGVSLVDTTLIGPGNQQRQFLFLLRTAGTNLLGTYAGTLSFRQFTESGTWRIERVRLWDNTGNVAELNTATLQARGFATTLNVTSTPDTTAPRIDSLEFLPAVVNVSTSDATVRVRMRLTDSQSGLGIERTADPGCSCTFQLLTLVSPSGRQTRDVANADFNLVSGTRRDGVWEGSFVIPRFSEAGAWTVQSIWIRDAVTNQTFATSGSLAGAGLPSGMTVNATPADVVAPSLTSFALSPATVDTSLSFQTLTFTFGVTDNLSGADFTHELWCPCDIVGVLVRSPSGGQLTTSTFNTFTQVSGTALNGLWQGTVVLPRFAERGTWSIEVHIKDRTQNPQVLTASDLRANGFPASFAVLQDSYTPDGTIGRAGGTVDDQVFGGQASLTVPNGALTGPTTVSIDVLQAPPNIPYPQGFSGAATRFVNINLVPHPVAPLPPPGYGLTIPLGSAMPPATPLQLYRLDPITGNLTPARGVSAMNVTGMVDPSGLTATFTGIASFSTVVGLLAPVIKPGDVNNDGAVNCTDVSIVRSSFGKRTGQPGFDSRADINRDGSVDVYDLSFVLRQLPAGSSCK